MGLLFDLDDTPILEAKPAEKRKRHSVEVYEIKDSHVYKRAHSELQLLNALNDEKLKEGHTYNFMTSGDVDALSYLHLSLRTFPILEHLIVSTWCMGPQDLLSIFELVDKGKIKKVDFYLGEIFPSSYPGEWVMINNLMQERPGLGRIVVFRNHSKIFAAKVNEEEGFGIQMSCNINTNPRCENGSITVSKRIYDFYKGFFDDRKSVI